MKRINLMFLSYVVFTLLSSSSSATQIPPMVRSATSPMFAYISIGPAIAIRDGYFEGRYIQSDLEMPTQFKMAFSFGYHLLGGADGPAIAGDLQFGFGDDAFVFNLFPRFLWDIQMVQGLGLYFTPSFGFGYVHVSPDCQGIRCSGNGMTFQFAFEGKLVLDDRWLIIFRPMCIDVFTGSMSGKYAGVSDEDWTTGVRYDLLFSVGMTF